MARGDTYARELAEAQRTLEALRADLSKAEAEVTRYAAEADQAMAKLRSAEFLRGYAHANFAAAEMALKRIEPANRVRRSDALRH